MAQTGQNIPEKRFQLPGILSAAPVIYVRHVRKRQVVLNATVEAACKENSFDWRKITMIRNRVNRLLQVSAMAFLFTWAFAQAAEQRTTAKFAGAKANTGTAIHTIE